MSRIGRKPVPLPKGVTVNIDGRVVSAKGPKGDVAVTLPANVSVENAGTELTVALEDGANPNAWGLSRTLVANAVNGVAEGFKRRLLVVGVGYRAEAQGSKLTLNVGYSHSVVIEAPPTISFSVEPNMSVSFKGNNHPTVPVVVEGADKQLVGDYAAKVRAVRPPEPYLGKGIRYEDERIRTDKTGKAAR